ncbi:MAG: sigma-70 family RNA polymerase sigma factor [Bacteroidales bacterium]|nr:sigma-70 family RNA polymerase sigma factor [Bacteroidales bacterium]
MAKNIDRKLIESLKKGNRKAQKEVFDLLAPIMFSVCLRYSGNRETAEDILQDGFVTLFSKIDSYKGDGSFEGWARKIFVNTALMELRKKDALKMSEELDSARSLSAPTSSQIEDIGYKELMELIAGLPAGFRTVFNMYVIEGYSHKEIAETLGITEVTSRSQLNRARAWLQARIAEKR